MLEFEAIRNLVSSIFIKFVLFIILLLVGFVASVIVGKILKKAFVEFGLNGVFFKLVKKKINIEAIIITIISYSIFIVSLIFAFIYLGLSKKILLVFAIMIFAFLIISLLLNIKDFVPNFFVGIKLKKYHLKNGEFISSKSVKGKILSSSMTGIKILTKEKDLIFIPNTFLIRNGIKKE